MDKRSYSISRDEKTSESVYFVYDKVDGYRVNPKAKKKDSIEVSKIVFVNDTLSEKIIRKKIDKKIAYLLAELKLIEEEGNPDEGAIKRSLMDAEKLKLQIINNYVKYLGHTYQSLTLKKIQIIVNQLRFKLYNIRDIEREKNVYYNRDNINIEYGEREGRRGRWGSVWRGSGVHLWGTPGTPHCVLVPGASGLPARLHLVRVAPLSSSPTPSPEHFKKC